MKLLVLLLSFISMSAMGQVKHLVFDLNNLLISGVPKRNAEGVLDKSSVITLDENGRTRYYYIAPYAANVIRSLNNNPQFLIHFYSANDPRWMQSALNQIYVNKDKGITLANFIEANSASKFFSSEDLVAGKIDLRKISSDLKNVIFLTAMPGQLAAGQESQELYTGQSFYVFENYAAADAERNRVGAIPQIPKDDNEWFLERHRFPRLNAALRSALKSKGSHFRDEVLRAFNNDPKGKVHLGLKQMSDGWREIGPRWKISGDKVVGCGEFNNITDQELRSLKLEVCQNALGVTYELKVLKQDVKSCQLLNFDRKLIKESAPVDCIGKVKLLAHWIGQQRNECAYFTVDAAKIAPASPDKCHLTHYMLNPYNKEYQVIDEYEVVQELGDFDRLTLEEIFNRNKPTMDKVLQLWYPYDKDDSVGFSIMACRDPNNGHHTIREDSYGYLMDSCKPDTLYSWGPRGKLTNLISWMGKGSWVSSMRPLFMVRSPVGSFGYGEIPIRVKIKPGMRWVETTESHAHCNYVSEAVKQNTVFYRTMEISETGNYLLDYTVCAPGPIESWSYGQKEHYDEIVKEYKWITTPGRAVKDYELYMSGTASALNIFFSGIDGYTFSEPYLVSYLQRFIKMVETKDQAIFWNPDVPSHQRTKTDHFSTRVPMYYNEK